jgi:hypothetical protein
MDRNTALSKANTYLAGTGYVADADDVYRNDPQGLWLIGTSDPSQEGDIDGATAVVVPDDGRDPYEVNRAPIDPEWDGVELADQES